MSVNMRMLILCLIVVVSCTAYVTPAFTKGTHVKVEDTTISACRVKGRKIVCATYGLNTFPVHWKGAVWLFSHCLTEGNLNKALDHCFRTYISIKDEFHLTEKSALKTLDESLPICSIIEKHTTHNTCVEPTPYILRQYSVD